MLKTIRTIAKVYTGYKVIKGAYCFTRSMQDGRSVKDLIADKMDSVDEAIDVEVREPNVFESMGLPAGMGMAGSYAPAIHTITVYEGEHRLVVPLMAAAKGMTLPQYIDAVLSHELGHAVDETLTHANLMNADNKKKFHYEVRAWRYGMQFTENERRFSMFNLTNLFNYAISFGLEEFAKGMYEGYQASTSND